MRLHQQQLLHTKGFLNHVSHVNQLSTTSSYTTSPWLVSNTCCLSMHI